MFAGRMTQAIIRHPPTRQRRRTREGDLSPAADDPSHFALKLTDGALYRPKVHPGIAPQNSVI